MTVKKTKPVCKCEDNTARANAMYTKLSNQICEAEENLILQVDKASEINRKVAGIMGDFAGVCRNEFELIKLRQQESLDYICSKIKDMESQNYKSMRKAIWRGIVIGLSSGLIANLIFFGGKALWAYLS